MKQATSIAPRRSPWALRAALLSGFLLLGALVGWAARPEPLLGRGRQGVAPKETVLGQIYHAKMVDTEAAWLAVRKRFPDLDIRHDMMADQGLARLYLREQRYPEAHEVCLELLSKGGASDPYVQRFAIAGLTVSLVGMGEEDRRERRWRCPTSTCSTCNPAPSWNSSSRTSRGCSTKPSTSSTGNHLIRRR